MKYAIASYGAYLYATKSNEMNGGNNKQEWLLAKYLAARHHEVILIVPSEHPLQTDFIDGVRLIRSSPKKPALLHVLLTLRREKPDWFHVMGASPNLWISAQVAHMTGIKCAYALAHDLHCRPSTALKVRRYMWPLYALGLHTVDRILAQHTQQINLLAPIHRNKSFVVNNIVEVISTSRENVPYISWVGWLRKLKRPELLIEIAKRLPEYNFVICGPISENKFERDYGLKIINDLKQLSNVDYRGYVTREETQHIIAKSSILLSTASAEGFPNTFLEAWASGVPTIALGVDSGGIMQAHKTGLVVSSVDEAINTIIELLSSPDRLTLLGQNAYSYAQNFHSGNYVVSQLEDALENKLS